MSASEPSPDSAMAAELLAAILAEPHEDSHRQVYADFLLERGDPRGEFIALQLAAHRGELSRAGHRRMRSLAREHRDVWLQGIIRVLRRSGIEFERGFPCRARVRRFRPEDAELVSSPLWATFEQLEHAPLELLRHPALGSLRAITCSEKIALALLGPEHPLPAIERLCVRLDYRHVEPPEELRGSLEQHVGLPNLRVLALRSDHLAVERLAWIWEGKLGAELERVELTTIWFRFSQSANERLNPGLARLLRSLRRSSTTIATVELEHCGLRWILRRGREPGAEWRELELHARFSFEVESLRLALDELLEIGDVQLRAEINPAINPGQELSPELRTNLSTLSRGS